MPEHPHRFSFWVAPILFAFCLQAGAEDLCTRDHEAQILVSGLNIEMSGHSCGESTAHTAFIRALKLLARLPQLDQAPENLAVSVMPGSALNFFKHRVQNVVFENGETGSCADNTDAFVRENEFKTLHICPGFSTTDDLVMADTLLHESRHTEGYPHMRCERGRFRGANFDACDETYRGAGAYALEVEFNVRVARTETLKPSLRQAARASAVDTLLEHFNETPFAIHEGVLLEDQNAAVSFYDGENLNPFLQLEPGDVLTVRAGLPTVYSPSLASVRSYVSAGHAVDTGGDYASAFRTAAAGERAEFLDVLYTYDVSCMLTTRRLRCDRRDVASEIEFRKIRPRALLALPFGFAVIDESGTYYSINTRALGTPEFSEEAFIDSPNPEDLVNLAALSSGALLTLNRAGAIRYFPQMGKPAVPLSQLQPQSYRKMIGPFYWSEEVAEF